MVEDPGGPRRQALTARVTELADRIVASASVDGAGVALVTEKGYRATVCATDGTAARLEELQFLLGEGPCVDATNHRAPVMISDLTDHAEGVQDRWPGFLREAAEAGVRALFALPLRLGAVSLGAIDLYRGDPGPLSPDELRVAMTGADAAALLLLDFVALDQPIADDGWQRSAYRFSVHGAAGMLKEQMGTTIDDALAQLRAVAFAQGRPVQDVADDVIGGRLRFPWERS
jgi:transcriptional regulator with GAF, ATPase, and Fis domain